MSNRTAVLLCIVLTALIAGEAVSYEQPPSSAIEKAPSPLTSKDDGWLDVSGFLDQAYGFLPVAFPITEPAVSYGLGGGLLFVDRDRERKDPRAGHGRPNITAVGGMGTQNGTWGVFAGDSRYWLNDRLQTLVGVVHASVNLDFYGVGEDSRLRDHPLGYNLEPDGGLAHAKYRLGDSKYHVGLGYAHASTTVTFDSPAGTAGLPGFQKVSRVGGMTASVTYDSRDNIFTPRSGLYLDASGGMFRESLGGDDDFQRGGLTAMGFWPLGRDWTFGLQAMGSTSSDDTPFYMRPFIALRGVPSMHYLGEDTAQFEAEVRWQCWKRFSIVAFGGGGVAWNNFTRVDNSITVESGGLGFRYEIARSYGIHMGLDAAYGPDGPALYVQMGSAWVRP